MMKPLDNKLVLLGSHIDSVRRQLKITQELLCAGNPPYERKVISI